MMHTQTHVSTRSPQNRPSFSWFKLHPTSDTEPWLDRRPPCWRWWPQLRGTHLLGRVCHLILSMKTCSLAFQKKMVLLALVSLGKPDTRSSLSTTGMQEGCTNYCQSRASDDSIAFWGRLRCRRETNGISTGRDARRIKRSFRGSSSASSSNVTHLPHEPLGSIKVRKIGIIWRELSLPWAFQPYFDVC